MRDQTSKERSRLARNAELNGVWGRPSRMADHRWELSPEEIPSINSQARDLSEGDGSTSIKSLESLSNVYRFTCGRGTHLKRRRPSCQTSGRSTMVASGASHDCRWTQIPCKNRPTGANGSYTRPKLGHSSAVIAISRMPASRRRNSKPRRRQRQALSVGGTPSVTDRMLGSWSRGDIKERRQQYEYSPQIRR